MGIGVEPPICTSEPPQWLIKPRGWDYSGERRPAGWEHKKVVRRWRNHRRTTPEYGVVRVLAGLRAGVPSDHSG
jgi:hypothetical protein